MLSKKTTCLLSVLVLVMLLGVTNVLIATGEQSNEKTNSIDLSGTWRVTLYAKEPILENRTLLFVDDTVVYHPGNDSNDVTSEYELKDDTLIMKSLNKTFQVVYRTDHFIELIEENNGPHWLILQISLTGELSQEQEDYEGDWDVILHGNSPVDEHFSIIRDTIYFYKPGNEEPYFSGSFKWEDENIMYLDALKLHMAFYKLDDNVSTMIEQESGYVWEIHRSGK